MQHKFEKLEELIDRLDNLAHALTLNLPDKVHVDQLRESIPDIVEQLKVSFVELSGEKPWE